MIVRAPDDLKDANDCLRKDPALVKRALDDAGAPDHDGLVSFKELRGQVLQVKHPACVGAPLPSFPKRIGEGRAARQTTLLTAFRRGQNNTGVSNQYRFVEPARLRSGGPSR